LRLLVIHNEYQSEETTGGVYNGRDVFGTLCFSVPTRDS